MGNLRKAWKTVQNVVIWRSAVRRRINFHRTRVRILMNNNKVRAYETASAGGSLHATLTFGLTSFMQISGASVSRVFWTLSFNYRDDQPDVISASRSKFKGSDRCVNANENNYKFHFAPQVPLKINTSTLMCIRLLIKTDASKALQSCKIFVNHFELLKT